MPSLINTSELDTEYPVPGQDNDSQGFRDNFTSIKTNLDTAKSEIEVLQDTTVKINVDTTFLTNIQGLPTTLNRANLKSFSTAKFPVAPNDEIKAGTTLTLNFADGDYQVYQFTQPNMRFNFDNSGWPTSGRVGKITLELTSTSTQNPEFLGTKVDFASGPLIKFDSATHSSVLNSGFISVTSATDPVFLEIWTRQGGTTLYVRTLGEFKSI
jgi:hypothetical protein